MSLKLNLSRGMIEVYIDKQSKTDIRIDGDKVTIVYY